MFLTLPKKMRPNCSYVLGILGKKVLSERKNVFLTQLYQNEARAVFNLLTI